MDSVAVEWSFDAALAELATLGLNLAAFVPDSQRPTLHSAEVRQFAPGQGLLLLLSMGQAFAEQTPYADTNAVDPFDARARALVQQFLTQPLSNRDRATRLLYPDAQCRLDLAAWLLAARVHYPSLLGLGIRPDCGTWFAVRAAVCTTLSEAEQEALAKRYPPMSPSPSPCQTCPGQPCISACPATAVDSNVHLERCTAHRLSEHSSCSAVCHSRLSCPVGREHMYPPSLLDYHYGVSLHMLRRWKRTP